MRNWLKWLSCLTALLCLCSCSAMEHLPAALQPSPQQAASNLPDLRQLAMPAAQENPWQPTTAENGQNALQVDLWLDASQVMGGVNPHAESLYPHRSHRYREGGFHYRYENQTGWYENLLRDLLSAAEGSRVRVLRSGNEHITDEQLMAAGLSDDPTRRPCCPCAGICSPMPSIPCPPCFPLSPPKKWTAVSTLFILPE